MGETFYSVLGVKADADTETIRRAYREQVKEHHPDVSDDPAASETFKRLTTAKAVLVDDTERRRYDRLGHATYVRDHVDASVWTAAGDTSTRGPDTASTRERSGRTRTPGSGRNESHRTHATGSRRTARADDDGATTGHTHRRSHERRRAGAAATATAGDWQHASETYRRAETDVATSGRSTLRSVLAGLLSVGPWLFLHLVFIGSAAATAYLAVVTADAHVTLSWPTLFGGIVLLGAVVFASVLHVVSQLYS